MIVDYHTHNRLCKHAEGEIEEYIESAVRLGLDEIACSDHAPLPGDYDSRHRMTLEQFNSSYSPMVSSLAERYAGKIRIRRAIEVDYLGWFSEWNRSFIAENDFDFVLGSVHFIGQEGNEKALFGPEYGRDQLEALYEGFFEAIAESARSGLFDVVSHCDIVKKFGRFTSRRVRDLTYAAMEEIRKADLCIEVNTSGFRKPEREQYPGTEILSIARDLGIPLTIGSDAHSPQDVGRDFDKAAELIELYGNGKIAVFEKRRRSMVSISRTGSQHA